MDLWDNDRIQFARMLGLAPEDIKALAIRMDLEPDEVHALLSRASKAWAKIQASVFNGTDKSVFLAVSDGNNVRPATVQEVVGDFARVSIDGRDGKAYVYQC